MTRKDRLQKLRRYYVALIKQIDSALIAEYNKPPYKLPKK
mgnify:FL=1|tara:strand:+ start:10519 stop:10638 length:120 start_codon:yes stop_codon:yes gene_type:complete